MAIVRSNEYENVLHQEMRAASPRLDDRRLARAQLVLRVVHQWQAGDEGPEPHTVHHEAPGVHWSSYREMHMSMADAIDPSLNQHDLFAFLWRRYVRQKRVGVSSHLHACEKLVS